LLDILPRPRSPFHVFGSKAYVDNPERTEFANDQAVSNAVHDATAIHQPFPLAPGPRRLLGQPSPWHFALNDYRGEERLMYRITVTGVALH
jgi:hypothetical protein